MEGKGRWKRVKGERGKRWGRDREQRDIETERQTDRERALILCI